MSNAAVSPLSGDLMPRLAFSSTSLHLCDGQRRKKVALRGANFSLVDMVMHTCEKVCPEVKKP